MSSAPHHHYHLPMSAKYSAYAPSTKASDISRLLDPSYTSSSPVHASSSAPYSSHQTTVYVDHSGDFHDPDYRDFPIVNLSKKPRWEQNWTDRDPIDEEDEELEDDRFLGSAFNAYTSSMRSTSRSRSPVSPSSPITAISLPVPCSPYIPIVSPSSSLDDEDDILSSESSPFASDVELEKRGSKRSRRSLTSKRRRSDCSSLSAPLQISTTTKLSDMASAIVPHNSSARIERTENAVDSKEHISADGDAGDHNEWTPSCSMAIRRQWQAVRLRLGLSVFRAKRRLLRRVGV